MKSIDGQGCLFFSSLHGYNTFLISADFSKQPGDLTALAVFKNNVEVALSELTGVKTQGFQGPGFCLWLCTSIFSQHFYLLQAVGFLGKSSQLHRAHWSVDASQLGIFHVATIK